MSRLRDVLTYSLPRQQHATAVISSFADLIPPSSKILRNLKRGRKQALLRHRNLRGLAFSGVRNQPMGNPAATFALCFCKPMGCETTGSVVSRSLKPYRTSGWLERRLRRTNAVTLPFRSSGGGCKGCGRLEGLSRPEPVVEVPPRHTRTPLSPEATMVPAKVRYLTGRQRGGVGGGAAEMILDRRPCHRA